MKSSARIGTAAGAAALLTILVAGCGEEPRSDPYAPDVERPAASSPTSASGTPKAGGLSGDRETTSESPGKRERRLQGSASKLAGDSLGRRSR